MIRISEWWFRCCVYWAWIFVPGDWVFYTDNSFERSIYDAVLRAEIHLEQLKNRRHWERIASLKTKGTPR